MNAALWADHAKSVSILAIAGLSLDAAVQMCLVLSLRCIYMLESAKRSRLNGLFMAWVFGCGAAASAAAASIYEFEGWLALMSCGVILVTIGFAFNLIESTSVPQA